MWKDIWRTGVLPKDRASWHAEARVGHRVSERMFLIEHIPADSVGAELGVFTGLFSAILARQRKISKVTFVDPWWLAFGDRYPSWGAYTAFGALSTHMAHQLACARAARPGLPNRIVEPAFSYDWLRAQPDQSLDWVYLDSTHTFEGTKAELALLDAKMKPKGIIMGDDWQYDRNHKHHGVTLAVNEFVKASEFEIVFAGVQGQWGIRRALKDRSSLPMIVDDADYPSALV